MREAITVYLETMDEREAQEPSPSFVGGQRHEMTAWRA